MLANPLDQRMNPAVLELRRNFTSILTRCDAIPRTFSDSRCDCEQPLVIWRTNIFHSTKNMRTSHFCLCYGFRLMLFSIYTFSFTFRFLCCLTSQAFSPVHIRCNFLPVTDFCTSYVDISRLVSSFSVSLCPLDMSLIRPK